MGQSLLNVCLSRLPKWSQGIPGLWQQGAVCGNKGCSQFSLHNLTSSQSYPFEEARGERLSGE